VATRQSPTSRPLLLESLHDDLRPRSRRGLPDPGPRAGVDVRRRAASPGRRAKLSQPSLWSSTLAVMAWVLIASMPFSALAFVAYP
jgi:hypothetical protein